MVDFQPDDFQYDDDDKYGVLERALRDVLEKAPSEELTRDDLVTLKRLSIPSVEWSYGPFVGALDLTLLAGCIHLTELNLSGNRISDIGPLAELRNLKALYLSYNRIVDITPLKGLTQLEKLYLNNNQIIDLKPLVDNPGLVNENPVHLRGGFDIRADVVSVGNNPLSEASRNQYIPALEARGVIVRR